MSGTYPPWAVVQGPRPTTGNVVEFLVDNEVAWSRLADEIRAASRSVRAMLFMLDAPHVRMSFDRSLPGNAGAVGSVRLEELLLAAANRGVDVAILLNHVVPSISPANTTRAVEGFFRANDPARHVRIARFKTPQAAPIHAKIFVIDDRVAFLVGSAFAQEYFDGRRHRIDDPRRGQVRWRSSVMAPVHDVSVRVQGPAVADLDETFRLHWRQARPDEGLPPSRTPSGSVEENSVATQRNVAVQVTRTLHGRRFAGMPAGETGIFESYVRALDAATDFVYIENQYLTCVELVDAAVAAMLRNPDLQLIALVNMRLDIPGYVAWQREAIERLYRGLGTESARAGFFTLWSHEAGGAASAQSVILRNHVHSKLAIVDDAWLTLGSANLDGTSLVAGEHATRWPIRAMLGRVIGAFGSDDPKVTRSSEVNVTMGALAAAQPPVEIGRLRRDLWAEHLGYGLDVNAVTTPALDQRPGGGWLELWRERAAQKLEGLLAPEPVVTPPRVLPYPVRDGRVPSGIDRPEAYLQALGVSVERVEVRSQFRSFSFREGRWQ